MLKKIYLKIEKNRKYLLWPVLWTNFLAPYAPCILGWAASRKYSIFKCGVCAKCVSIIEKKSTDIHSPKKLRSTSRIAPKNAKNWCKKCKKVRRYPFRYYWWFALKWRLICFIEVWMAYSSRENTIHKNIYFIKTLKHR